MSTPVKMIKKMSANFPIFDLGAYSPNLQETAEFKGETLHYPRQACCVVPDCADRDAHKVDRLKERQILAVDAVHVLRLGCVAVLDRLKRGCGADQNTEPCEADQHDLPSLCALREPPQSKYLKQSARPHEEEEAVLVLALLRVVVGHDHLDEERDPAEPIEDRQPLEAK
jgi:hypothetical protein